MSRNQSPRVTPTMLAVLRACVAGEYTEACCHGSVRALGMAPHVRSKAEMACRMAGLKEDAVSDDLTAAGLLYLAGLEI